MKKEFKITPGIFPMPVIMIATYNEDGSVDVMNAAWGMASSMKELILNLDEDHKTVKNIKRTKACTISMATKDLMTESDYLGIVSGNNTKDKFEKTKLTATKSQIVDAPIIEEYPICMECKLIEIGEEGTKVEILSTRIDEKFITAENKIRFEEMNILTYDPYTHGYYVVAERVGEAFKEGQKLK